MRAAWRIQIKGGALPFPFDDEDDGFGFGLGWWVGLDWARLDWLGWAGVERIGLEWVTLV